MYKIKEGIHIENIDDEIIVVDTKNGKFLSINQIGYNILTYLIDGKEINTIVNELIVKFGIAEERANQSVNAYINKLLELGVLEKNEQ